MSTGNLNPQPPQNLSERLKEIPLTWFVAIGTKARGVSTISFSDKFDILFRAQIDEDLAQYSHHMGNTFIPGTRNLVKNSSEIADENTRAKVQSAEKRIKEVTGFSADDLWDKKHELFDLYHGKKETEEFAKTGAFIEVELY